MTKEDIKERLEYIREELRAGTISYGELAELQSYVDCIDSDDIELLEAAGVSENITQTVFIVYRTDNHHTIATREIIGIGLTKEDAIQIIIEYTIYMAGVITPELLEQLKNINQTQGFSEPNEFMIEEYETNKYIETY